jgi:bile acid-coenzyme A ligase
VAGKQITKVLGIAATDCQLVAGPLYHSGPFIFSMLGLFEGNHLIVLPRFDALQALDAIDTYCVSLMMVVPTMMSRMLSVLEESGDRHHLRSMRRLWHMSAPCPQWLKRKWIEILGPERIFELYGGTEAQSTTIIDGVEWLQHPGSVGRQALGEMIVLDEQGAEAPRGEVGEIFMRPTDNRSTYRYVGAEPRRLEGWESIGDLGWMDQDGYLYIADRRKDLILRGGANIYPAEVEGALSEHRSVGSCAVVGVSDDDLGQRVHAIVHLVAPADEGELLAHLQERLVRYKVPETWEFVDSPVRDEAGKVRRSALALRTARRNSRRSTRCDAES